MPKLTINGREIEVPGGVTVLQACELAGAEIPRFCYHDRLSVAGNCRMCLVEMERAPKPIASCAMPAGDGMVIHTDSEQVRKARKGVMEFLLINHPLDCPICDQGGECDLQDQAMAYGFDRSRYDENKRAVSEKYMGPLVKTIMTRCIHCTRCVRFSTEVAGVEEIGALGRGEHLEITTLERAIHSEMSGNVVDVCPVGALTSKPYAFHARSWELRKTDSVDVMDAVGSNIRVDCRGREVMRVLPRLHEDINEEWIADKTRYACDGLRRQRLDQPYLRGDQGKPGAGLLAQAAFEAIAGRLSGLDGGKIAAIAGDLCDAESMLALKDLMTGLGSANLDCRQDGAKLGGEGRASYLFNSTIAGIEEADAILIGRHKSALGGAARQRADPQALPDRQMPHRADRPGARPDLSGRPAGRRPGDLGPPGRRSRRLRRAAARGRKADDRRQRRRGACRRRGDPRPGAALGRGDRHGQGRLERLQRPAHGRPRGLVGSTSASCRARAAGTSPASWRARGGARSRRSTLLGADEIDMAALGTAFVIYQGHHGDAGAHRADVILPGAAYTEKNGTYVNTEGRVQLGRLAGFPPGDAREDWTILRALSGALGRALPYDNLGELRRRLIEHNPVFAAVDQVEPAEMGRVRRRRSARRGGLHAAGR